jgi:hypothetical protein
MNNILEKVMALCVTGNNCSQFCKYEVWFGALNMQLFFIVNMCVVK